MRRHAYLIMAHNNFSILKRLISILDDERNDIFIHIDAKIECFDSSEYAGIAKRSKVQFIDRIPVYWGDYSQIQCEYNLLRAANGDYEYYHLLSGTDLPIKTQDEIHSFFNQLSGKSLIQFVSRSYAEKTSAYYRLKRYKFFQKYVKSNKVLPKFCANLFQHIFMPLQTIFGVDRTKKKNISIGFGANWFSLYKDDYKLVIEKQCFVEENFKHTLCADELFIQTILLTFGNVDVTFDEDFNGKSHGRYIDWNRGNPYIFRTEDYDLLINSQCLFARKFDENIDFNIINKIYDNIKK
ncbi:core-2/I-Branching enzyme [Breznakia blatticola]|uniref:Peptide O-xylosyltransferase n=1 Tax=Breznakia blatticola TaxID=1754012 RepID=A0A4R7Z980_9FIRM|nr:beta-1,6-N-acetylglucosaminyltransferase [Breznakia blatticola]TDW13959.1 core-2/I-Branching enzyme [Breznakia blatticola]